MIIKFQIVKYQINNISDNIKFKEANKQTKYAS